MQKCRSVDKHDNMGGKGPPPRHREYLYGIYAILGYLLGLRHTESSGTGFIFGASW